MKFYKLIYVEDENQENPSIQDFRDGYDTSAAYSATHIHYYKKIDYSPDFDFLLDGGGKATDLLAVSFISSEYLLVSGKFYDLLKSYNLLNYQHFDAVVRDGNRVLPYHFLNFYFRFDSDEADLIDFEKTKFVAEKTSFPLSIMAVPVEREGVVGEFQVSSWGEYHKLRDKVENDSVHKVVMPSDTLYIKKRWLLELDLFYVEFKNFGSNNFVVSERLAKEIIGNGITGVKVEPLPFEIKVA